MRRLLLYLTVVVLLVSLTAVLSACGGSTGAGTETSATVAPASTSSSTTEPPASTTTAPAAPTTTVTTVPPIPEGVAYTNVLFMGAPESNIEGAWAVTHLLITLDPTKREIRFTQFPYNLLVDVETEAGVKTMSLISVSDYGQDKVVETLEKNFGVEIDHWALTNLNGLAQVVDVMGGVEIDIKSLSINKIGREIVGMLMRGFEWQDVSQTGPQVLSGVQAAGYMEDTRPQSDDRVTEEELNFRDHHENMLTAVVGALRALGATGEDLVAFAEAAAGNYATGIEVADRPALAETVAYCLENDPQFLFVPKTIVAAEGSDFDMVYDQAVDVPAVQAFVLPK